MVKLLLIGIMGISTFNFGYCSIVLNERNMTKCVNYIGKVKWGSNPQIPAKTTILYRRFSLLLDLCVQTFWLDVISD